MGVNLDKPERWKTDIARSVDLYNDWFMKFAPKAYRDSRVKTA
jgi:type II restriction enzyme